MSVSTNPLSERERQPLSGEHATSEGACSPIYVHQIDAEDRLTRVNEDWLRFAAENDAPELTREIVIGRSLWEFMACPDTKAIYRTLLHRVRVSQKSVQIPYRCDSPGCRRFMVMELSPLADGGVCMSCRTVRTEVRPAVHLPRPQLWLPGELTVLCGWCKKVEVRPGEWVEIEDAASVFGMDSERGPAPISHGICPACSARWLKELGK